MPLSGSRQPEIKTRMAVERTTAAVGINMAETQEKWTIFVTLTSEGKSEAELDGS